MSTPSGAASPSTEKTESVTASARPPCARSALRTASGSACGTTAVAARESLQPSTIEAWLPASETISESCPVSAVSAARFAA